MGRVHTMWLFGGSAIGVAQVPFGACVEIEMIAENHAAPTDIAEGSSHLRSILGFSGN